MLKPPTGEPYAGKPPVRFAGRGGCEPIPTPIHDEVYVGGHAPIATEALARIKRLYDTEADIRGLTPEVRQALRQQHSKPEVVALKVWFEACLAKVSKTVSGLPVPRSWMERAVA